MSYLGSLLIIINGLFLGQIGTGVYTIDINKASQIYKIRVTP